MPRKKQNIALPRQLPKSVKAEAKRITDLLGSRLRPEDKYIVAMFAAAWTVWLDATATVAEEGKIVMSGGTAVQHPQIAVAAAAGKEVLALGRELGLSPASRKKLRRRRKPSANEEFFA